MKSVIVGTAGHIDHGKTALVKALTGIDADRLEEEKRRGITIDIGFAHLELPGPAGEKFRLGFVDVPGHERFVRNMLAGVGGIDLVLLVVAADEGVKPQTREHFDICRLLSIPRGITVITKSDAVDAETLEVVRMEVSEFLRGSFLDPGKAPMVAASAKTGAGLDELKRAVVAVAAEAQAKDSASIARLPIDRVFTMKGFGTVVTGTLVSGTIKKEQELELFPSGRLVRVRGVQVHGRAAEQAVAGERTALNLAGAAVEDLARGMTLIEPGVFHTTERAQVSLALLGNAKPLRDRARVHVHVYTTETIAEVRWLAAAGVGAGVNKPLKAGGTAYAELRFAEPVFVLPGDRFIIRQFSPVVTIGGGVVLDASPLPRRLGAAETAAFLETLEHETPQKILMARVARRGTRGLKLAEAAAEAGWRPSDVEQRAAGPLQRGEMSRLGEVLLSGGAFRQAQAEGLQALAAFHDANPLVAGISKEELRDRLGLGADVFGGVLDALVREKKVETSGEQVRTAGRGVVLKDEEAESKKIIEQAFAGAGLKVPALKDVLAGVKVDRTRAQKIMTLLLRDRVLVKLSDDLVFHRDALDQLRKLVVAQKAKSPKIDVARFKDLTGVSRKYAIPLLEYLDRERVTRRVGDERVIL
ncbi:MAG: selenocysteine-specific translation elongation factor [Terriglobales bacterium]